MSLYAFQQLEQFLDRNGYPPANAGAFQVIRRELLLGMQKGDILIRKDGIFCTIDGYEHRGYIFNQKPDISQYGIPKFHIADCEVVQNRGRLNGDYIWTNTEQVQLYDRGQTGIPLYPKPDTLTTLLLCSKCKTLVRNQISEVSTTDDFHEYLSKHYGEQKVLEPVKTDIFGYTFDFTMISRQYRELRNYQCERCHIDLSKSTARRYLHVHHRNGRKADNRPENLECLCVRCHAAVDERHENNFHKRINRRELEAFNERFSM